ncbi:MAG: hypothetical protein E7218_02015 [Anaerofustis stercorihominis]|nr:hypothetical protein [Anaerofustis stercorihominis]
MNKKTNIFLGTVFVALLLIVASSQYMLYKGSITATNNFDNSGSIPASESSIYLKRGTVGMRLSDERIKILVNGEYKPPSDIDGNILTYDVHEGDVFHADLREADNYGVIFISFSSEGMLLPVRSSKFVLSGGVSELFTVKIAE